MSTPVFPIFFVSGASLSLALLAAQNGLSAFLLGGSIAVSSWIGALATDDWLDEWEDVQ